MKLTLGLGFLGLQIILGIKLGLNVRKNVGIHIRLAVRQR